ncbi:hypothetical protein Mapa_002647 [Marchantia paleacea]|nr:hypothetical protein Mapa_002647 [Marchantia paleacea]
MLLLDTCPVNDSQVYWFVSRRRMLRILVESSWRLRIRRGPVANVYGWTVPSLVI